MQPETFPRLALHFLICCFVFCFVACFVVVGRGFSFYFSFNSMQVNIAFASRLLACIHGNVSSVLGLQIYYLASRGYSSFLMTSQTQRKTILKSKYTYCFVPFPTDTNCYRLFCFGCVLFVCLFVYYFFQFLSVNLGWTDLQFSSIQIILHNEKKSKDV